MEEIIKKIQALDLPELDKLVFLNELKSIGKKLALFEFKYNRTLVDKSAITNVLNATIKEIEEQKTIIEQSKNEIARNLEELDQQKQLVDQQNRDLAEALRTLELAQSKLVQSEKMASLGQLTAGVAHEINNPINFVSGNIEPLRMDLDDLISVIDLYDRTIKEKGLETAFDNVEKLKKRINVQFTVQEIQDLLSGIEDGARRTTEIVKGLKNFSRSDRDVFKRANLNEGIESTLAILHSTYKNRVEIVKEFGDLPDVDCLPGQVNQVIMNILSNAVQAIPETGTIFIKTYADNDFAHIAIRDTGTGMTAEVRNKIFDPFFTTKDVGKGTGLGLSISYGIIEKHKGTIEVHSVPDEGTEFIVSLPLTHKNGNTSKTDA